MDVNERIARALGWTQCSPGSWHHPADPGWPCGPLTCRSPLPDYAHSLDACLPVLADLKSKGWFWAIDQFYDGRHVATIGNWNTSATFEATADTPAAALAECLAECLADALEAK